MGRLIPESVPIVKLLQYLHDGPMFKDFTITITCAQANMIAIFPTTMATYRIEHHEAGIYYIIVTGKRQGTSFVPSSYRFFGSEGLKNVIDGGDKNDLALAWSKDYDQFIDLLELIYEEGSNA